jgi:membrane protease subunit HflK
MQDWENKNPAEEIEKKIVDFINKVKAKKKGNGQAGGEGPSKSVIAVIILLAVLVYGGFSSFYEVDTEETGVVLRLGKFSDFSEPGLHFKIPFGVDEIYLVPTGRVLKEEFGFRTVQAGVRTSYTKRGMEEESLTLTGDLNVSDIEWIVQYQVADPFKFIFRIKDPVGTIRDISEAVVRSVVGNSNVSDVLTTERAVLASKIETNLQKILNDYDIGVRIVTVKFQDVTPPDQVKAAFNEVNEAEQQKESMIFKAREQYNREVPRASGQAKQIIQEAEGYAAERINKARGESNRFLAILAEYRKAPTVTRQRMYLETMETILPQIEEIYIMDEQGVGMLPLLPLRSEQGGKK